MVPTEDFPRHGLWRKLFEPAAGQKRLVDDWFKRFSVAVKKPVDPDQGYDNSPLSTKTTFNAVTHARLKTHAHR